jgi:hypothetical protein
MGKNDFLTPKAVRVSGHAQGEGGNLWGGRDCRSLALCAGMTSLVSVSRA